MPDTAQSLPQPPGVRKHFMSVNTRAFTGIDLALLSTFEVFPWTGSNHSLERFTERSVGLVTDRPGNVDELLVTLFE